MKILVLLGNGFDLALGLPTSYRHFLSYYTSLPTENASAGVKKLHELMQKEENKENWSDLEWQLGQEADNFKSADAYMDAIEDVRKELNSYLSCVDKWFLPDRFDAQMYHTFVDNLQNFHLLFDTALRKSWETYLKEMVKAPNDKTYAFITFNYTSTLEKMLNEVNDRGKGTIKVGKIVHVHQTIDNNILMGVNDFSQISKDSFRNNYYVRTTIEKPYINKEIGEGYDEQCKEMIDQADCIILFGLSLGKTDHIWWQYIGASMTKKHQRIVYSAYDTHSTAGHWSNILKDTEHKRQFLLGKIKQNNATIPKEWIYPIRQNRMFNFGVTPEVLEGHAEQVLAEIGNRSDK